jgi:hypothetical protein
MAIFADLAQDVRYALRQLRRSPLFALTATLSLAVGIGANAALFTLVDRLLWRPLPVARPEELVLVTDQRSRVERSPRFSYPFYTSLARDGQTTRPDASGLQGVARTSGCRSTRRSAAPPPGSTASSCPAAISPSSAPAPSAAGR